MSTGCSACITNTTDELVTWISSHTVNMLVCMWDWMKGDDDWWINKFIHYRSDNQISIKMPKLKLTVNVHHSRLTTCSDHFQLAIFHIVITRIRQHSMSTISITITHTVSCMRVRWDLLVAVSTSTPAIHLPSFKHQPNWFSVKHSALWRLCTTALHCRCW